MSAVRTPRDAGASPLTLALIGAVALALRLAFVATMPDSIPWPDGREYVEVARGLLAGHGFGMQTLRPPGYPAFIALVWSLTGSSLTALRMVEACLGTITVLLVGCFGVRLFGTRAGLLAMAFAALHPVLAFLPSTQYSENLVVFFCVLGTGLALEAMTAESGGRGTWGRWIVAGVMFGLAALTRPNAVILLPALLLGGWLIARGARRAFVTRAAVCLLALAFTLSPWLVRNHRMHGHWFFIATGGGRSLWLGSNDRTTGRAGSIMVPDSALTAELMRLPDEVARDRRLAALGFAWMRADPARAVRMYLVRLSSLWALYPDPYTRNRFSGNVARIAQAIASVAIFLGALLALRRWREVPLLVPMMVAIVLFSLVNAMFFMVLRYRMPFEPMLVWMAGLGWTGVLARPARGEA